MNSRERVLAALNHQQPDRVPVDLSGHRSSGIAAVAYPKLREYLGLPPKPVRAYDMVQQLAIVDDDVLGLFGVDTIEMGRGFLLEEADWKDWVLPDGTPCKIPYYINVKNKDGHWYIYTQDGLELGVQKKGCLYFEQTYWPLLERGIEDDDFSDLPEIVGKNIWAAVPHPGAHLPLDKEGMAEMTRRAKAFRQSTDRAVVGLFGGNMFELPQWIYRMDNYLTYMGLYPDQIVKFSEKLCSIHLENLEKWMSAVGDYVDVVLFGDDLGCQNGPLMSPDMYRKYYKPYHKKMFNRAKELGDIKTNLHCCGGIIELLGDLIEAGLDSINPVQISCAGMDSATLKSEFGDKMTFWGGGCDTRDILPNGTPEQISKSVKEQVKIFNKDGGFIFQQVHNIMANIPPENIVAMYDAVKETYQN